MQRGTYFRIADNSGARLVKCIGFLKQFFSFPCNSFIVSIRKFRSGRRVKKGEIYRAVLVTSKNTLFRPFGHRFSFNTNSVVILKKGDLLPIANRVTSCVFSEVRKKYPKIASISKGIILKLYVDSKT